MRKRALILGLLLILVATIAIPLVRKGSTDLVHTATPVLRFSNLRDGDTISIGGDLIHSPRIPVQTRNARLLRFSVNGNDIPHPEKLTFLTSRSPTGKNPELTVAYPFEMLPLGSNTIDFAVEENGKIERGKVTFETVRIAQKPLTIKSEQSQSPMNILSLFKGDSFLNGQQLQSIAAPTGCKIPIVLIFLVPKSQSADFPLNLLNEYTYLLDKTSAILTDVAFAQHGHSGKVTVEAKYPAEMIVVDDSDGAGWKNGGLGIVKDQASIHQVAVPNLTSGESFFPWSSHLEVKQQYLETLIKIKKQYFDAIPILIAPYRIDLDGDSPSSTPYGALTYTSIGVIDITAGSLSEIDAFEIENDKICELKFVPLLIAHEIGHTMGLDHDEADSNALMTPVLKSLLATMKKFQACHFRRGCFSGNWSFIWDDDWKAGVGITHFDPSAPGECANGLVGVTATGDEEECEITMLLGPSFEDPHNAYATNIDCDGGTPEEMYHKWPSNDSVGHWGYPGLTGWSDVNTPYVCYKKEPISGKDCAVRVACGNGLVESFEQCEKDEDCEGLFVEHYEDWALGISAEIDIGRCSPPDTAGKVTADLHCICYPDREFYAEQIKTLTEKAEGDGGGGGNSKEPCASNTNVAASRQLKKAVPKSNLNGQQCAPDVNKECARQFGSDWVCDESVCACGPGVGAPPRNPVAPSEPEANGHSGGNPTDSKH